MFALSGCFFYLLVCWIPVFIVFSFSLLAGPAHWPLRRHTTGVKANPTVSHCGPRWRVSCCVCRRGARRTRASNSPDGPRRSSCLAALTGKRWQPLIIRCGTHPPTIVRRHSDWLLVTKRNLSGDTWESPGLQRQPGGEVAAGDAAWMDALFFSFARPINQHPFI